MIRWVWLLVLAACDDDKVVEGTDGGPDGSSPGTTPPALTGCAAEELALEAGVGQHGFAPLADADALTIAAGPAGGAQVYVAGEVSGATAAELEVTATLRWVAEDRPVGASSTVYVRMDDWDPSTCAGTFWGVPAYLDTDDGYDLLCALEGELVEVTITVTGSADRRVAEATGSAVAVLDELARTICDD